MDYAIVLYFDKVSEEKIQTMIEEAARCSGNNYMINTKIPPHITISSITSNDEQMLLEKMEILVKGLRCGEVYWASMGVFNPYVLFLSPVLNEFLQKSCEFVNNELLSVAKAGDNGNYVPFSWVPHTAIACKLEHNELIKAFELLQNSFKPFGGMVNKVALAKCNPYKEIRTYNLLKLEADND